jgi:hypothetical protein
MQSREVFLDVVEKNEAAKLRCVPPARHQLMSPLRCSRRTSTSRAGKSFAPWGVGCFAGFHLETFMKAILLIVATLLVGYFAIGTGVSATDQVEKRTSHIEKVLEDATK